MNRLEFIIQVSMALIAVPAALSLESCAGGGGDEAAPTADGFDIVSNPDNTSHSHSIRLLTADLSAPPAGGVTYASTGSHTHTLR